MKAIVYKGVHNMGIETTKDPELKNGEALLRVKAAAICGTDLRIYQHGHHLIPEGTNRILGHEISGVIELVSGDAAGPKPGMTVAVAPNIHCGTCGHCIKGDTQLCEDNSAFGIDIDGGFAEYIVLPAKAVRQGNIIPMKTGTDFVQAALNEPLSCCYNSLEYTQFSLGETILIIKRLYKHRAQQGTLRKRATMSHAGDFELRSITANSLFKKDSILTAYQPHG